MACSCSSAGAQGVGNPSYAPSTAVYQMGSASLLRLPSRHIPSPREKVCDESGDKRNRKVNEERQKRGVKREGKAIRGCSSEYITNHTVMSEEDGDGSRR